MPVAIKPYECIRCLTTNPNMFYEGHKTWCKVCSKFRVKGESLVKYHCRKCGTTKKKDFYEYLKCECKNCKRDSPIKKKVKIIIREIDD